MEEGSIGEAEEKAESAEKPKPISETQMRKRLKERGAKLVVSAEVSKDVWDALEKRVGSGEFETRSDLVRAALDDFLRV